MGTTQEQGALGETLASQYLSQKGYRILERNWRSRRGEIDLIVSKNKTLFFVEVKLRKTQGFGSGFDSIHPYKQKKMVSTVLSYLQKNNIQNQDVRLAALVIEGSQSKIDFFEFPLDLKTQYYY